MGSFYHQIFVTLVLLLSIFLPCSLSSTTRRFEFNVKWKNVKRLCNTRPILTVNGEYPGPTISVHEGDNVEVKVTNRVDMNTTLHWHGIRQLRTGWADGPAYVTQCPIGTGKSYTYRFTVVNQRGTLWWHAHLSWQRSTVNGAFIIYPRMPYPFSVPIQEEIPITFGEWFNSDVMAIEKDMMLTGVGPNASDAYTINGLPGPLYNCSLKDTFIKTVEHGKTYLLRIINAALNDELFFAVADHTLTVVEIDAVYTKPFTTKAIMIAPGQTTNVLLTANQKPDSTGMFVLAARPYLTSIFPFDNSTTIGFLKYKTTNSKETVELPLPSYTLPSNLPALQDTEFATEFANKLRSLGSPQYPCKVPRKVHKQVITTIGLNLQDCPPNKTCKGFRNQRFLASMNNQSFIRPPISILECHYKNLSMANLFSNFPEKPPVPFNYTGVNPLTENMNAEFGSKLVVVPYGTRLEIVLQDTNFLNPENHPIHVHGHNFFIVGRGFGNFDAEKDPLHYNLVDPPERNTVAVPIGGWAAIRIHADNPGVWFIHCHLEEHTTWGLAMGLVVQEGKNPSQCLIPPPDDLPPC
ncbi:laccase-1 [Coffea eugenioides]|uniref:laccase-1 n=1 Tax=Coffea eugenioides TaxID=49369 RepID=UPI000F60A876|nr:laccase-1 [Coffea eugenioides]